MTAGVARGTTRFGDGAVLRAQGAGDLLLAFDDLVDGRSERMDGLRALCAAAWAGEGVTAESARTAARRLDDTR